MAWLPQKQLDTAVDALAACANAMTTHAPARLRIRHPSQNYDRHKWEAVICAMFAASGHVADAVLPDGRYLMQSFPEEVA